MKRLVLLLTAFVPSVAFAIPSPFLDVVGHPHESYVDLLRTHGVVGGYGYGIFRPDIPLNRAEFLKITMGAAFGNDVLNVRDKRCFADFTAGEQWYYTYACAAKERDILHGYPDGTFRGERQVILAEALKMAVESWKIPLPQYGANISKEWFAPYMDIAGERGLLDYFPNNPGHVLTRSEMAYMLVRLGQPIAYVGDAAGPIASSSSSASSSPVSAQCGNGTLDPGEQCDDGNILDSDGCSSICVIVPEPTRHAVLVLEQRPLGTAQAAGGAKDVPLLAMHARVARQDARMTTLKFIAEQGGLGAARNYRLLADTDGNDVVDAVVASAVPENGVLTFSTFNLDVRQDATIRLEVWADLLPVDASTSIGLGFAITDPRYAEAIGTQDSRDLSGIQTDGTTCSQSLCWIGVYTQAPRVISVVTRGNLYLSRDTSSISSQLLLAGTRSPDLLRLTFAATEEDIDVTKIILGGGGANVDRLELFAEGAAIPFASATNAACEALVSGQFCAVTQLRVPKNGETRITVRARVKNDTEGAVSGQTISLTLSPSTVGTVAVEARGVSSVADLSQNDGDAAASGEIFIGRTTPGSNNAIISAVHDIAFARIASIQNANGDPDNAPIPTGEYPIGVFRFAADMNTNSADGLNRATVRRLTFRVTAQNIQMSQNDFKLYNTLDPSRVSACSGNAVTGEIIVSCDGLQSKDANTSIDAGGSIALALRGTIINPAVVTANASQLQVRLADLSDRANPGLFVWDDGVTTFSWVKLGTTSVRSTLYKQ